MPWVSSALESIAKGLKGLEGKERDGVSRMESILEDETNAVIGRGGMCACKGWAGSEFGGVVEKEYEINW